MLPFAIGAATGLAARAVVLCVVLATVCIGFWYCFDATYVHLSTMNFMPEFIACVQSLVAGATLLGLWFANKRA